MKAPRFLFLSFLVLAILFATAAGGIDQGAFFIPIPSAFAPVTGFGCPDVGTVFTYNVPAWNTNRPNRMVAIEQDQFNCRIRSDAWGTYDWFGGLGARLDDTDVAEKQLIRDLWPLRSGTIGKASKYDLPSSSSVEIEYAVSYGFASVPAGLFWAYKIRKEYYWQNKLYHTTTLWWSPSLKWTILQWPEEPGKASRVGGYNWELLSVSSE
ncbi:hypothetical protein AS156_30295 [Bradyrhizobium macuxiense]|uniref:Uncharacterized protein n=1 Tax=Bradyrhizobium macuxiense TaxID=1755647 RepID=A0A109K2V6_9BRAD|nr:hypothetical protein [Bradyrhizobium macuxiense]KWV59817.1 hypothetical protein AS156_30295 [Bradyrhizobium macuxiense]